MNRKECEKEILEKLKEIEKIHKEYNPNANYLTLCCLNGHYAIANEYWEVDKEYPINCNAGY